MKGIEERLEWGAGAGGAANTLGLPVAPGLYRLEQAQGWFCAKVSCSDKDDQDPGGQGPVSPGSALAAHRALRSFSRAGVDIPTHVDERTYPRPRAVEAGLPGPDPSSSLSGRKTCVPGFEGGTQGLVRSLCPGRGLQFNGRVSRDHTPGQ